eukprot:GFKZ01009478.1.p1 GENE.GFKZ01009478.1~~GFKZ01009478.1.p1  ORF type:complete len:608 (-),score=118.27 GFKZ01009478.1:1898-3721(-)
MRIQYKGGVWKNSEDEILKAAVMKYGKNQWARIASLLVRKSAKQCKARWYEWLDPSIKKTEWTREEEEKLLHLAKIMPTSWRTIAPMIGRTPAQCLEHYDKLLDQAQRGQDGGAPGPSSAADPGDRSRPETLPARPDPVDMDEDELEMLSEARARLANTKGKKAKRKAREKQLEAAKRLAQLQKGRELKAAGIEMKPKRRSRKFTDYATEIPFERAPVPGFYDTRDEDDRLLNQPKDVQIGKLLQKYKGKSQEEKEQELQKRDTERRKQLEKLNPSAALALDKAHEAPRSPPLKRARMSLPPPKLSDAELKRIAKLERNGQPNASSWGSFRARNESTARSVNAGGNSSAAAGPPPPLWASVRQKHIDTLAEMTSAQTPLRGGPNTSLSELGLNGSVTPMQRDLGTGNPLATPFSTTNESKPASHAAEQRRVERERMKKLQETIKRRLRALPEPENEYEIEVDESLLNDDETGVYVEEERVIEDAEDERKRELLADKKKVREETHRLISQAARCGLPLPAIGVRRGKRLPDPVDDLVLMDNAVYEANFNTNRKERGYGEILKRFGELEHEDDLTAEEMQRARELVETEVVAERELGGKLKSAILKSLI